VANATITDTATINPRPGIVTSHLGNYVTADTNGHYITAEQGAPNR